MATVTRYVNTASTAGGDGTTNATVGANRAYASLSEWESNEQTDLVSAGDIHHCIFEGSDTTAFTISGWTTGASNYIKITVASANRHSGNVSSGAKISNSSSGSHVITISQDYTWIEYLIIQQDSSGGSDEGVRITSGTNDVLLSRNIIYTNKSISDQDGVYTGNWTASYSADNNIVYGFNRGGFHLQNYSGSGTQTANLDYNTVVNCGGDGGTGDGGIISNSGSGGSTNNINAYNCAVLDSNSASADDWQQTGLGTHNWTGDYNADSDGTLLTSTTNSQQNLTLQDTAQGSGNNFIVQEKDSPNFDFQLNTTAFNNAVDNGSDRTATKADSRQDYSTDIAGNSRSGSFDIGASEISAGGEVNATTASLNISEQSVTIGYDVNTNSPDALVISEQAATIGYNVNTGTPPALTITENPVTLGYNLTTNTPDALVLTGQQATIGTGGVTNINTTPDSLVIAEQSATIGYNVTTNLATLTVTGQQATISEDQGETIDGAPSKVITANYGSLRIYFNGSDYFTY